MFDINAYARWYVDLETFFLIMPKAYLFIYFYNFFLNATNSCIVNVMHENGMTDMQLMNVHVFFRHA